MCAGIYNWGQRLVASMSQSKIPENICHPTNCKRFTDTQRHFPMAVLKSPLNLVLFVSNWYAFGQIVDASILLRNKQAVVPVARFMSLHLLTTTTRHFHAHNGPKQTRYCCGYICIVSTRCHICGGCRTPKTIKWFRVCGVKSMFAARGMLSMEQSPSSWSLLGVCVSATGRALAGQTISKRSLNSILYFVVASISLK